MNRSQEELADLLKSMKDLEPDERLNKLGETIFMLDTAASHTILELLFPNEAACAIQIYAVQNKVIVCMQKNSNDQVSKLIENIPYILESMNKNTALTKEPKDGQMSEVEIEAANSIKH